MAYRSDQIAIPASRRSPLCKNRSRPGHFRADNLNDETSAIHSDHNTKRGLGSAEDDPDAMCSLVIGKHDAEVAVEGDAIDLH